MEAQNRNQHLWLMVLCCLIPLAALGAIFLLGVPVSNALVFALILLCPLSHLLLMGPAGHEHGTTRSAESLAAAEMHPQWLAGSLPEGEQDAEPSG